MNTVKTETKDLYTPGDVKTVREGLLVEQQGLDIMTGFPLDRSKTVLDHAHDDNQFVRGVLDRGVNRCAGVCENAFKRYLSSWYPGTPSDFFRKLATYLDRPVDQRYRHPGWISQCKAQFNRLKADQQNRCLESLGYKAGTNLKDRKANFNKLVLDRNLNYDTIMEKIKNTNDLYNSPSIDGEIT